MNKLYYKIALKLFLKTLRIFFELPTIRIPEGLIILIRQFYNLFIRKFFIDIINLMKANDR